MRRTPAPIGMEDPRVTLNTTKRLGGLALAAVLLVAACSGGGATTAPSAAAPTTAATAAASAAEAWRPVPPRAPRRRLGAINVSGSSTVEPISTGVAEALQGREPGLQLHGRGPGHRRRLQALLRRRDRHRDASRKIKDEEAAICQAAGIEFVELKVAYRRHHRDDEPGQQPTSPASASPTCTRSSAPSPRASPSGPTPRRSPRSSGSNTTFPDADLAITGPGEESGTFDYFVELVLDADRRRRATRSPTARATTTRPDYTSSRERQRHHRGHHRQPQLARLGGLRASPRRTRTRSRDPRSPRTPTATCVAPDRRRRSPTAPTRYPATLYLYVNKAKAADEPGRRRVRRLLPGRRHDLDRPQTVPYVNLPAEELRRRRVTDLGRR